MKKYKSIKVEVSGPMRLRDVLPQIASPWYSVGDAETLRAIGEMLEKIEPVTRFKPQWGLAQEIANRFAAYIGPEGGYQAQYERSPSGYYKPGKCLVSPVFSGVTWGFALRLVSAVGRTISVELWFDGNDRLFITLVVDFGKPSIESATIVIKALEELKLTFRAETAEVPNEFDDAA